jgi:uncharacterized protein
MYKLETIDKDGKIEILNYDPHSSILTYSDGRPVVENIEKANHPDVFQISPTTPGKKSHIVNTLKIQLGLKCNYSCQYCSQSSQINDATITNTNDAREFFSSLSMWLHNDFNSKIRFEFWGGEPLLYWKKIKTLTISLRKRYPNSTFVIISNGSLMTRDKIDFIEKYDIQVGISHDGPGQSLRGLDPFDDQKIKKNLIELFTRRKNNSSINSVITKSNINPNDTIDWFINKLGIPDIRVTFEGIVNIYDESASKTNQFTDDEYNMIRNSVAKGIMTGSLLKSASFRNHVDDFINSIKTVRQSSSVGQKCGMDRPDQLSVDLKGNAMTCQNTGAKGKHGIGNVNNFDEINLDTSTHWAHRKECRRCPVLQLCKGACMFLDGEEWYHTCQNEYYFKSGVLAGAIFMLTGRALIGIDGNIVRPEKPKKKISIKAVINS